LRCNAIVAFFANLPPHFFRSLRRRSFFGQDALRAWSWPSTRESAVVAAYVKSDKMIEMTPERFAKSGLNVRFVPAGPPGGTHWLTRSTMTTNSQIRREDPNWIVIAVAAATPREAHKTVNF
jgi:hypothetical protein